MYWQEIQELKEQLKGLGEGGSVQEIEEEENERLKEQIEKNECQFRK